MSASAKLKELGIELPAATQPAAAYIPVARQGNVIYISGQLPLAKGELMYPGHLGREVTVEQGYEAARQCCLNALSHIAAAAGDLDQVKRIIKLLGFVSTASGFAEQHLVINGASELLQQIFGEKGRHARSAIGVAGLPMNAPVEVEMIVELEG